MHSLAPETDVRAMNVVLDDARLENRGQTTVFWKIGDRPRFSVIRCPVKTVVCPPFLPHFSRLANATGK